MPSNNVVIYNLVLKYSGLRVCIRVENESASLSVLCHSIPSWMPWRQEKGNYGWRTRLLLRSFHTSEQLALRFATHGRSTSAPQGNYRVSKVLRHGSEKLWWRKGKEGSGRGQTQPCLCILGNFWASLGQGREISSSQAI